MQGAGSVLLASLSLVAALLCALLAPGAPGCMAAVGGSRGGQSGPEGVLTRPLRPAHFHTPEELRHYLDAVSNYYAVASRPGRFGKRSSRRAGSALQALQALEALEALERGRDTALDTEEAVPLPDYLFAPAPGPGPALPAPAPASEEYPLFLEQERLSQPRQNQMQE